MGNFKNYVCIFLYYMYYCYPQNPEEGVRFSGNRMNE